jgi:peptide/nickel transport system ATP-binding protein
MTKKMHNPNFELSITDLAVWFSQNNLEPIKAIDGLTVSLPGGKTMALVGESGCGKTLTGLAIMGLLPDSGSIVRGSIKLGSHDITTMNDKQMSKLRGLEVSMIFQEPMTSLNPLMTIGKQIAESLHLHLGFTIQQSQKRVRELLHLVGFPNPLQIEGEYPHRLSGGMRQRVMIAIALACEPKLLIADEPTTALDVTVQAQVLEVLRNAVEVTQSSLLLITHDLSIVANMADLVAVMYAGSVIEIAKTQNLFQHPHHPYTQGLLDAVPQLEGELKKLKPIPGLVPNPAHLPKGCRFTERCPKAFEPCYHTFPDANQVSKHHSVHCHLYRTGKKL